MTRSPRPAARADFRARLFRRGLLVLVLLGGWRCTDAAATSLHPLLRDLARSAGEHRSIAPRLSISRGHAPCREVAPPADGTVARAECAAIPAKVAASRTLRRVSAGVRDAGVQPEALHASALLDLLWGGRGTALDRAIQSLHAAARLSDAPAPLLADLAGAYLVRAERTQAPGDLDRALEAAEEAVERDWTSAPARYNRALALERIGLAEAADEAWQAYLRVDDASGWADEARAWLRDSVTVDVAPPERATPASAAAFAGRAPQQANTWGWETLLPAWGAAVTADEGAAADSLLGLAEAAGGTLAGAGRDATLADAVAAIRAAADDRAATERLARAHAAYGEGRRLFVAADFGGALALFTRAAAEGSAPLRLWARLFRAGSLAGTGDRPLAEDEAKALAAGADSVRYPALAGRARWVAGTIVSYGRDYEEALAWYRGASRPLERAGEDEHAGSVQYLAAHVLRLMGSHHGADGERHRALLRLRPYPRSVWRHNALKGAAEHAGAAGLYRTALHYQAEDVRASTHLAHPHSLIEARLGRVRLLAALGQTDRAVAEVHRMRPLVESLQVESSRDWFRNDLRLAEVELELHGGRAPGDAELDSAVDYFARRPAKQLPALLVRASARLANGNVGGGREDLGAAAALVRSQGQEIQSIPLRGALFSRAREIFDRLALAHLAAGDIRAALADLEHGRSVFAPFPSARRGELRMPAGQVGLEYALVGDTLLAWTVAGDSVRMVRRILDGAGLVRTIERARSSLETGREDEALRAALSELYDHLVRPVEAILGPAGRPLVVVADGPLAAVPFAGLYDRRRGRYLVEDRAVRMAATLSGGASARLAGRIDRALLVADPAFDAAAYPGLGRLPGAAAEVAEIAPLYRATTRISGRDADSAGVTRRLSGMQLVHFAGHAVLDDAQPERSFLLLAGAEGAGRLTAEEIGAMDLRGVRLMVLSACETARGADGRSAGLSGLSAALVGAGAEGVLGSLWRVDDQLTRALMVEFHRAYRSSGDAAAALRAAQLALLRSSDARLRSPAAWAGFVHVSS